MTRFISPLAASSVRARDATRRPMPAKESAPRIAVTSRGARERAADRHLEGDDAEGEDDADLEDEEDEAGEHLRQQVVATCASASRP